MSSSSPVLPAAIVGRNWHMFQRLTKIPAITQSVASRLTTRVPRFGEKHSRAGSHQHHSLCPQSDLRALSVGVEDPKAIGFRRISINDLDWRPSPLPNADAWRAGELDLPAGAFNSNARPGFGSARPVHTVRTQHIGEDGDCVVALEGDEGGRFG